MSIRSQFPEYLALASRDGRGGDDARPPSINRGFVRSFKVNLATDPDVGDWTQGVFSGQLAASPLKDAPVLAQYSAAPVTIAGGVSTVVFTLSGDGQGNLPAGNDDALTEVFFKAFFTPTTGEPTVILDTHQFVAG